MDKKLLSLMVLFFLAFGLFATVVVFNKPLTTFTRAREDLTASGKTTLIFAWPLTVKADGITETTITVFARSESSKPLPAKPVTISSSIGKIRETTVVTDTQGKAEFKLSSSEPGTAIITATVENIPVEQKLSVKFE